MFQVIINAHSQLTIIFNHSHKYSEEKKSKILMLNKLWLKTINLN